LAPQISLIIIDPVYTECALLYSMFIYRLRCKRLNIEAFAAVKIPAVVFWTVTPCSRLDG